MQRISSEVPSGFNANRRVVLSSERWDRIPPYKLLQNKKGTPQKNICATPCYFAFIFSPVLKLIFIWFRTLYKICSGKAREKCTVQEGFLMIMVVPSRGQIMLGGLHAQERCDRPLSSLIFDFLHAVFPGHAFVRILTIVFL